ncbi:U11/U12 small nuclear ribonucleoprotein 35 kDa protein [Boleophthalmus pectinirostris]|uniref:U11/U12 small nuclear ribonucleoprotein 35 kDa protein n=1 Tax=Boleophthalmus pectinirostris TaxID=150288 RepID=UPI000A1C3BF1|nr:U11/U12 small nuclear ribonucleoprotein 35 kDa protein [Boleophthalmus pectinirostris]
MSGWSPIATEYDPLKAGSIDGTDDEPHDRAIFRAMVARYKPNKGVLGDPRLTLFVARLNPVTTEDKLHQVFSKFGDIHRLRLVRDIVTGFSKKYAFIEYKEQRAVYRAWREADKLVVDQHELFVDMEQERTLKGWVPRRLGGGLGGNKGSGQLRFGGRDRPFQRPINLLRDPGSGGPASDRNVDGRRNWDRSGTRERYDREKHRDYGSRDREDRNRDDRWHRARSRHRERR